MIARIVRAVALVAIIAGVVARFDALDRKTFWTDETFSALRVYGHLQDDLFATFDGRLHRASALLALQGRSDRGLSATAASLREEPQRGPLYYMAAYGWTSVAGDGVIAMRAFSAVLGIAGIALAFFVGRRLGGAGGGPMLAALVALSPVAIRFSQQFREYVLVADVTLLTAWLLLRALELPSPGRFAAYGCAAAAALYTNPTLACLVVAQGAAVLCDPQRRAAMRGYLTAAVAAAVAYAPWALQAAHASSRASAGVAWASSRYGASETLAKWLFNIGAVFFDTEYAHRALAVVLLPLLSLALLACAMAVREARRSRAARLTIATVLATSVPLAVLDAWHHAHFSLVTRYQMTTWIGLQMAVAFALATAANSQRLAVRRLAVCGFVVIAGAGLGAAALDREYAEWWDNNDHVSESAVGAVVRAHAEAVVVSSDAPEGLFNTFVLARYLAPDTPMLLIGSKTPRTVPRGTTVFLFAPSSALRTRIAERLAMPPHNVSPDIGLAIPNLNAARADDPMREDNALWIVRS